MALKAADATNIIEGTEQAIKAAKHLTDADAGAVEALRVMARKIAVWDRIFEWALEDAAGEGRPAVPQNDNVTLSAYIKASVELGLTPSGRTKMAPPTEAKLNEKKSALASVSTIPRPTA